MVSDISQKAVVKSTTIFHDILVSARNFGLGSMAGAFGAFMVYPIDLVKSTTIFHDILVSARNFGLGSMAGAFGTFMVYPIDLGKTRWLTLHPPESSKITVDG
jgi:3-isopropylmalate dehydratase small subunit